MTQFGKQRSFQCFHFLGFLVIYMVVTKQMQAAVNHQVSPMGVQRLALLGGFTLDHGHADHQIAQQRDVEELIRHIGRE